MSRPVTTAEITEFEPLMINPAEYTLEHNVLMKGLAVRDPLKEHMGRVKHAPFYGQVVASGASEGVEVSNPQIYSVTDVTFTPSEIVCQVILTDKAVRTSGEDQVRATGKLMGDAMARKCDQDGLAEFDNFTVHALGSGSSTDIAVSKLSAAITILKGNDSDPAPSPIFAVLRPEQLKVCLDALGPTAGTYPIPEGLSEDVIREYLAHDFKLLGLAGAFWSGNLTRVSSGTVGDANTSAKGAVFSKQALRFVPADEMSVEKERLVRARSWLFQATQDYAYGIYKNKWGVEMNFNAEDPS